MLNEFFLKTTLPRTISGGKVNTKRLEPHDRIFYYLEVVCFHYEILVCCNSKLTLSLHVRKNLKYKKPFCLQYTIWTLSKLLLLVIYINTIDYAFKVVEFCFCKLTFFFTAVHWIYNASNKYLYIYIYIYLLFYFLFFIFYFFCSTVYSKELGERSIVKRSVFKGISWGREIQTNVSAWGGWLYGCFHYWK